MDDRARVLELAHAEGFELAGLAPFRAARALDKYRRWIAEGRHASMDWLARVLPELEDPLSWAPEGRSLLVVGKSHARPALHLEGGGRVARYAAGRDYHNTVRRSLRKLARKLREEGLIGGARSLVDDSPLFERSHAEEAGLGFASKAANLLHPDLGPWFFLGELILDVDLSPTGTTPPTGSCGTCTACLDACPTGALVSPGELDARRCISWATIEERGPVPHELREDLGEWVFGCDVCSEVCPWGKDAAEGSPGPPEHPAVEGATLLSLLQLDPDPAAFGKTFEGSPLRRAGREGLAANAALVLGNVAADGAAPHLAIALHEDPSAKVREAAAWSLLRGFGEETTHVSQVEQALRAEVDPTARAGMRRSLERYR